MRHIYLFIIVLFLSNQLLQAQYPELIKDIYPGIESGTPYLFKAYDGLLYFSAVDTAENRELWVSDGTESGTYKLKDIKPDPLDGSHPSTYAELNGKLYFQAKDWVQDRTLWVTDGTEEGTLKVIDTADLGYMHWYMEVSNGHMYFSGGPSSSKKELWISDGTSDGSYVLKEINPGEDDSSPRYLIPLGDKLFFYAYHEAYGNEPWITDGTADGTVLLQDINPGPEGSLQAYYGYGGISGTKLYFAAYDSIHGAELWVTDGTTEGTYLLKEIIPGTIGGFDNGYSKFTEYNDYMYFTADDTIHGMELWRTDGTTEGTILAEDIYPGESSGYPGSFVVSGGKLYFFARTPEHGGELRVIENPNSASQLIKDIVEGPESSYSSQLVAHNGYLYFRSNDGTNGFELWTSDGTETGTIKLVPQSGTNYDPLGQYQFYDFGYCNNSLYYSANYDDKGAELYKIEIPVTINEVSKPEIPEFELYPNPAMQILNLDFTLTQGQEISFHLTSTDGKRISKLLSSDYSSGRHLLSFPLPDKLPYGIYILEIRTKKWREALKFVKK